MMGTIKATELLLLNTIHSIMIRMDSLTIHQVILTLLRRMMKVTTMTELMPTTLLHPQHHTHTTQNSAIVYSLFGEIAQQHPNRI